MKTATIDNQALGQMLDAATAVMHQAGLGYVGAAAQERGAMQRLASGPLASWTDAEGQRVAQWLLELELCDSLGDQRSRCDGYIKAAKHIHRLVLQRLLRNLGMRWPADGLMLNSPQRPLDPHPLASLENVDLPPLRFRQLRMQSAGREHVRILMDEPESAKLD